MLLGRMVLYVICPHGQLLCWLTMIIDCQPWLPNFSTFLEIAIHIALLNDGRAMCMLTMGSHRMLLRMPKAMAPSQHRRHRLSMHNDILSQRHVRKYPGCGLLLPVYPKLHPNEHVHTAGATKFQARAVDLQQHRLLAIQRMTGAAGPLLTNCLS